MSDRFTSEQRAAIESRGKTIVSASAGSGKTTVMIEKIIRHIQNGGEVGEILAVTFTKKAAAQMKEKLSKAIIEAINAPETTAEKRAFLKRQLSEVPTADLCTIHSFCSKLIRTYFFAAEVDGKFRVIGSDDSEGTEIRNEALDELLEEGYEEKDESFLRLLSVYWRKKSDNTLRKILLLTYASLRDRADYREFLSSASYTKDTFDAVCRDLMQGLKEKCAYYVSLAQNELEYFIQTESEPQILLATQVTEGLKALQSAPDYFAACQCTLPDFKRKTTSKKDSEEKKLHIERLAVLKDKTVKIYEELMKTLSYEEELSNFLTSGETAAALAKYLLKFDEKYERLKRERGVLDYNDLEHKALQLLQNDEIVAELEKKYRYVYVDEYQDVNPVQEELVSRIGGENLFLVGDIKQSIYGFRGSKAKFFAEKQRDFSQNRNSSLHMKRNFRSSDKVLDAVNTQFSLAMTPVTSEVNYAEDSFMERGGRYALNDGRVQIHFLPKEEKETKKERGVYSVREHAGKKKAKEDATFKLIRHIIDEERRSKWYDADAGAWKEVRYSDICILSRKKSGKISETVAALAAAGIPVTAASSVNICEYSEVKTLMDILSLLDNAEQDIPLCSALLSSMGEMTENELTEIRLAYRGEKFYRNACKKYAAKKEDYIAYKLKKFFAYYEKLRALSSVVDAAELLTKIVSETRMEARLLTRENGVACLKRIHRFIEEANNPESLCVHAFLERLKNLGYEIFYNESGGEDSVKVMTMHSSKGLEYPIVILDNLSAPFHGADRDEVEVEERYGLAPKAYDERRMLKSETLLRRLYQHKALLDGIGDELNLYYVALTRAKFGLHMLFEDRPALTDVKYARSFAEFTDFDVWREYVVEDSLFDVPKQERSALVFRPDETLTREIMSAFLWEYSHKGYENLPVKSSATQLMAGTAQPLPAAEETSDSDEKTRSLFDVEEGEAIGNTGREAGIAYHAFLERFDFSALYENGVKISPETLKNVVQAAYERERLAGEIENFELLSVEKLTEILSSEAFYQLQDKRLYKEQQFLTYLPIRDTYAKKEGADPALASAPKEEEILFQGAIDLLAIGADGVAQIIDYKYSVKSAEELRSHYRLQLDLYKQAVAKIAKLPMDKIRCSIINIYRGFQVDMD